MSDLELLPTVYLDMNIVGQIAEGMLRLPAGKFRYVYSSEHYSEIARGNSLFLLDALSTIGAQELSVDLDNDWRITDQARFIFNEDIHTRYGDHQRIMAPGLAHIETFQAMTALMWGADNLGTVLDALRDLPNTILPGDENERHPGLVAEAQRVSDQLLTTLEAEMRQRTSLAKRRKELGSNLAQTNGLLPEQVIPEIWRRVAPKAQGLTIDQLFGANPIDRLGYCQWPKFLAVVQCHGILNTLGYRPDKGMADESRTANILSDGAHLAHAAFCDCFLTSDRRLFAKASVVYAFLKIATQPALLRAGQQGAP